MISFFRIYALLQIQLTSKSRLVRLRSLAIGFCILFALYLAKGMKEAVENVKHSTQFTDSLENFTASIIVIFFFIIAESFIFKPLKQHQSAIQYLMLPASTLEKWLAELTYSFLLVPLTILVGCYLAILLVHLTDARLFADIKLALPHPWHALQAYWIYHPLLFFCAIYFRHKILFKTFGSIAAIFLVSLALFIFTTWQIFDGNINPQFITLTGPALAPILAIFESKVLHTTLILIYFGYFWGLSYLRLREAEV